MNFVFRMPISLNSVAYFKQKALLFVRYLTQYLINIFILHKNTILRCYDRYLFIMSFRHIRFLVLTFQNLPYIQCVYLHTSCWIKSDRIFEKDGLSMYDVVAFSTSKKCTDVMISPVLLCTRSKNAQ